LPARGFGFAPIAVRYHPGIDRQAQSLFVWSVLGAIAQATRRLTVGTAVTCPPCACTRRSSPTRPPRRHFEAVAELVTEEQMAKPITCGPDGEAHLSAMPARPSTSPCRAGGFTRDRCAGHVITPEPARGTRA
jgi:hypothetical protein